MGQGKIVIQNHKKIFKAPSIKKTWGQDLLIEIMLLQEK